MVALSIQLVAVVSNGEQVLIGVTLVALVVASEELREVGIEGQTTAVDDLVGILDGLLQTGVVFGELWVGLRVGDGGYLIGCQRIVAPDEIGTCQQCLGSLLGRYAWVAAVVEQQALGIRNLALPTAAL